MASKVIMPLGALAGEEREAPNALFNLADDMYRRRNDLHAQAHRRPQEAPALEACANDLERYALALFFIWYQTEEPAQREQQISGPLAGYLELADKYNLTLPPELAALARKERGPRKPQERG